MTQDAELDRLWEEGFTDQPGAESIQAVLHDAYDVQIYLEAQDTYKKLADTEAKRKEAMATASAFIRDVFYAFHKPVVQLIEAEVMPTSHLVNRQMVEQMIATGEFKELHLATAGDELASAIATVGAGERMLSSLDKAIVKRLNKLVELEQQIEQLMTQADTLDTLAAENPDGEAAQKLAQRAGELQKQAQKAGAARDKLASQLTAAPQMERVENAARQAVRRALIEAEAEISELNEAIKAFGGGYEGGGSGTKNTAQQMGAVEKVKLALRVKGNKKLKEVAEVCGRFTRIALTTQKNKVQHPPDEVVGVKTGHDLAHLVTSELVLLTDPALETIFYAKFSEKKLLQYELDKQEPLGRGPIIVALDSSSSMGTVAANGLSREVWSKGAALALMAIARLQKRDIAIIHFSSGSQVKVDVFIKGEANPLQVMNTAEFFYGGGTDYALWMKQALKLVDQSAFNRADVIIVSDGDVQIPPASVADWNQRRKEREMRCYSVLIGETYGIAALSQISETVTPLLDLTEDSEALETMFSI